MRTILSTLIALLICFAVKSQVFTLVDSMQFSQAQIWGVLSDDGDSLCATTIFTPTTKPHIFMRKINYNSISQQSTPKQLTFDNDFTSITNLTDHKSIIFNNEIYVSFSTQGDQDMFIFKTDINGNRIGNIVTVVQSSTDPTNDMMLTTDGTYIFVLSFDPPNQSHVYTFDTNLNPIGTPFSTITLPHNNIGSAVYYGNKFWMFTGNAFGFNTSLVLTKWSNNFSPISGSPQTIVSTSSGDGNWFSTGQTFDTLNQRFYIGMNHIQSTQSIGQEHIDLLAFDINFNLLERKHSTSQGYFRPHFVLKNNFLYVSYDKSGQGVWLLKYQLSPSTGMSEVENEFFSVYPNPSGGKIFITLKADVPFEELSVFDMLGNNIYSLQKPENAEMELNLGPGIYILVANTSSKTYTQKLIVIK